MHLITKNDNAWNGLISRVKFGHGLVDTVTGQKLSFTRAGSGLKRFDKQLVYLGLNVPRVENNGPELRLEGSVTNKVTCAKSNPQDLTNITKSGDAAAVLSVVNDAAELASAGLSAFGPNVYKLDNGAGTTNAYAMVGGSSGNTNAHSLSCYIRSSTGGRLRWDDSETPGTAFSALAQYTRIKVENAVPSSTARVLTIRANPGSIVYFTLPQLEEGPVCTSPIPGGTGAITRASEGSDTSNNGLTMPLTQAMIDSLKCEMIDWSTAGTFSNGGADSAYVTVTAAGKKIKVVPTDHAVYWGKTSTLEIGATYESSVTISGFNSGSFYIGYGSTGGNQRTSNGTYVERFTATGNTSIFFRGITNSDFTVTINYCRRVLDSGQTNPGEGTVLCGVYLPYNLPNYSIPIATVTNSLSILLYFNSMDLKAYDGITATSFDIPGDFYGYKVLVLQYSAALGRMRVGLFDPTTGALTWGNYATYRGFFPITSTGGQRMRWFYGGGNFPVSLTEYRWLKRIASDTEVLKHCEEMKI